jgi:hypothetical protein
MSQGMTSDQAALVQQIQAAASSMSDEEATRRYSEILAKLPPEAASQLNALAFSQVAPEQRKGLAAQFAQAKQDPNRPFDAFDYDDLDNAAQPQSLGRMSAAAQQQDPALLGSMFGGDNNALGGTIGKAALAALAALLIRQFTSSQGGAASQQTPQGDVLGSILGSVLGGGAQQSPQGGVDLGSILGSVLASAGGQQAPQGYPQQSPQGGIDLGSILGSVLANAGGQQAPQGYPQQSPQGGIDLGSILGSVLAGAGNQQSPQQGGAGDLGSILGSILGGAAGGQQTPPGTGSHRKEGLTFPDEKYHMTDRGAQAGEQHLVSTFGPCALHTGGEVGDGLCVLAHIREQNADVLLSSGVLVPARQG